MIKKIIKWLSIFAVILALLLGGAVFTLHKMYPPQKLKKMAQEYVAKNYQREVSFDHISFTWIGFSIKNFALSENATFQDGTFVKAAEITAHVSVKPLLQKRIEISSIDANGITVNIIKNQDGTFNFDSLLSGNNSADDTPSNAKDTAEKSFIFTADKTALTHCNILYKDLQTGTSLQVKDLNIGINRFDLDKPFDTSISFQADISSAGQPDLNLPVSLQFNTYLANLDLSQAYATLTKASAQYKSVVFTMQGEIKNFQAPSVNLTGTLSGINNKVLADFAPNLPNFTLPPLGLTLQATADLQNATAQINLAKLAVKNSALSTNGNVGWGGNNPTYNLAGTLRANLEEIVQMTDTMNDFSPSGYVQASFKATEKKNYTDISGTLTLKDAAILYPPFTLTKTNGTVTVYGVDNITTKNITGLLNGEKFTADFSYKNLQNVLNMALNLNLDKLVIDKFPSSKNSSAATTGGTSAPAKPTGTTRMNIDAQVNIGGLKVPYLQSEGLTLAANLTDVTDSLNQTNGTLNFQLKPGQITNLDDFIKDSKTAKIILLPLSLIKKAAGVLKIDLFPSKNSANGTTINFTDGEGIYTFTNGVMNIDKTVFNSSVTNVTASGTADFNTDALDMKAKATLLTQAAPITFKITGTISDPKSKLDVVNTVGSVVGNLLNGTTVKSAAKGGTNLTKGAASTTTDAVKGTVNTAADVVKEIGGLFKKKKDPQEP